jgi:hypothetical protein
MRAPPEIAARHAVIDETLDAFRAAVAGDLTAYRGHIYRVFNVCRALAAAADGTPDAPDRDDKIAYAAAFHDLGIWSDGTVDYLPPSSRRLRERLERDERVAWSRELSDMVDYHHKLTPVRGAPLVEAFRRADVVDLSLGLVRFGLPRAWLRELATAFPAAGFHGRVVQLVGGWAVRHPLRPFPMLKV